MIAIDTTTSAGIVTSTEGSTRQFVIRTGAGHPSLIRSLNGANPTTVVALTYAGDQLFWLETDAGDAAPTTTIWRYRLPGGPAVKIASGSSEPVYANSEYDLQVDGGRLHWATIGAGRTTDIKSMPIDGGTVQTQTLGGTYTLSTWPWATRTGGANPGTQARGRGAAVDLLNLATGTHITARATPDQLLTCSPIWCRVTTDQSTSVTYSIEHPDGTGLRRVGTAGLVPLNTDVAILDRFEILGAPNTSDASGFTRQVWLHDLTTDHAVLLADDATDSIGARAGYLWWSTGGGRAAA